MSPDETQPTEPEQPEAENAPKAEAKKPAPKKKPAAKKPAAEEAAAEKKPAAKAADEEAPSEKTTAEEKPAAKKPAAKKPAEKAPAAEKKPAAKKKPPAEAKPEPVAEEPAEEVVPAPAPRRGASVASRAEVRAHARYVRTSARKARMVCGHLRGKSVQEARAILAFTPRDVARDWSKLLESAVANAENNHELLEDDLIVREAYADEGPTIKRFRPRAMGRATPIRKRTSHLTITLTPGQTGQR
jgi:ribosomal protein L22